MTGPAPAPATGTLAGTLQLSPGTAVALTGPPAAGGSAAPSRICVTARLIRQLPAVAAPGAATPLQRAAASLAARHGRTSGSAVTSPQGAYTISGLRPGGYRLQYRDCSSGPGLTGPVARLTAPANATAAVIVGGRTVTVAPAQLRPASVPALLTSRPAAWLAAAARQATDAAGPAASGARGRISGRVTAGHGRLLAGICVFAATRTTLLSQVSTGRKGRYLSKPLRPGRYFVVFVPGCGNRGNWLPQLYQNAASLAKATRVRVTARHTTGGIDAVMHPAGKIQGTVTSQAGQKLSGICVLAEQRTAGVVSVSQAISHHGRYDVPELLTGRYDVFFSTGCGSRANLAPQEWKDKSAAQRPTPVHVTAGHVTSGIGAVMRPGAKVSGTVTLGSGSGTPLGGICVELDGAGPLLNQAGGLAITRSDGTYHLKSLAPGQYRVSFFPGCDKNPNVVSETVPGRITLTAGRDTRVDGVLQRGGVITGTIASAAGQPLAGVCVSASGGSGGQAQSHADGVYRIAQLATGKYTLEFTGGCGNHGSLAPLFPASRVSVTIGQSSSGVDAVMQPGGTISGHVTDTAGRELSNICVLPQSTLELNIPGNFLAVTRHGSYQFNNEPAGQYQVTFVNCGAGGDLADQSFPGRPGDGSGALISVNPGAPTRGISAVMRRGGRISGVVTTRAGRGLAGLCVDLTNLRNGAPTGGAITGRRGRYTASGLAAGRYQLEFTSCVLPGDFASSWYRNKGGPSAATPVTVRAGRTTTGISGALPNGGSISGRVTSQATGGPVPGICVEAFTRGQLFVGFGVTGKNGRYTAGGLNTGAYAVDFFPCLPDAPALAGRARPAPVHVTTGHRVRGINAALTSGGTLTGSVRASQPEPSLPGFCVNVEPASPGAVGAFVITAGAAGVFVARNLLPGRYKVLFDDPDCGGGLVPLWFNGKASRAAADTVTVRTGALTSLPVATVAGDGGISGTVTGPSGQPLTGACVTAIPAATARAGQASVLAVSHGSYAVLGLHAGHYLVRFSPGCGAARLATQWWRNVPTRARARVVTVTAGQTTSGISATLKHAH